MQPFWQILSGVMITHWIHFQADFLVIVSPVTVFLHCFNESVLSQAEVYIVALCFK